MKTLKTLAILALFPFSFSWAQLNIGGKPLSFSYPLKEKDIPTVIQPALDMTLIEAEDRKEQEMGLPMRFGFPFEVSLNLDNSGVWEILPNGDGVWRLAITCEQAKSVNLTYDHFWMPKGALMYVYSGDKTQVYGGFTSRNNKGASRLEKRGFATAIVKGENLVVEYYEPAAARGEGIVSINRIVSGYISIDRNDPTRAFGGSGSCQVNVNCTDGVDWQCENNSVALIVASGNRWCTGSLMNSTCQDRTPLFLTANHCLGAWGLDAVTDPFADDWMFLWDYESADCTDGADFNPPVTSGAFLLANSGPSDFAIFNLTEDPMELAPAIQLWYNGWDATGVPIAGGSGIHHPSGDIKKISLYNQIPVDGSTTACLSTNEWGVVFQHPSGSFSSTEGGSSGSPLYDNNHRVIGQLWGGWDISDFPSCFGGPVCGDPSNDLSFYGKLSVSWNTGVIAQRRLIDWLDPCGTGQVVLDGRDEVSCPDHLVQADPLIVNGVYQAALTITVSNVIPSTRNVEIHAGNSVLLMPGFEAQLGCVAHIYIDGCHNLEDCDGNGSLASGPGASASPGLVATSFPAGGFSDLKVYPNPLHSSATIEFFLPVEGQPALYLINAEGKVIRTLLNKSILEPGEHELTLRVDDLPAGFYILRMIHDDAIISRKIAIVNK